MTNHAKKVLAEALELPQEARGAIAASLIESLDEQVDEDAEAAWAQEISRRQQEVREGSVVLIPWSEARRRILKQ